jgi:tetratricopeptide (TPR) repeat protein
MKRLPKKTPKEREARRHLGLGHIMWMMGDSATALKEINAGIALWPENPTAYNWRAQVYSSTGQNDLAIADFNQAINCAPLDPLHYKERALYYFSKGNHDLALEDYIKILTELDPNLTGQHIYANVLMYQLLSGRPGEWTKWFSKLEAAVSAKGETPAKKLVAFLGLFARGMTAYQKENIDLAESLFQKARESAVPFQKLLILITYLLELIFLDRELKSAMVLPPNRKILKDNITILFNEFEKLLGDMSGKNIIFSGSTELKRIVMAKQNVCGVILGALDGIDNKKLLSLLRDRDNLPPKQTDLLERILDETKKQCEMLGLEKAIKGLEIIRKFILTPEEKPLENAAVLTEAFSSASIPDILKGISIQIAEGHSSLLEEIKTRYDINPGQKKVKHAKNFPTPYGTNWSEIMLKIFLDGFVRISVKDIHRFYHYSELGFKDEKTGKPDKQWIVLEEFARNEGSISWYLYRKRHQRTTFTVDKSNYENDDSALPGPEAHMGRKGEGVPYLTKRIQIINKRLKEFFGLNTSAFKPYNKKFGYLANFKIEIGNYELNEIPEKSL